MQLAFPRNGAEADCGESRSEGEIPERIDRESKITVQHLF